MLASRLLQLCGRSLETIPRAALSRAWRADLEACCGPDATAACIRRLRRLLRLFIRRYGDGPIAILRAPARINLLGEHVDYVSYLPTASITFGSREHGMLLLARARADAAVRGISTQPGCDPFEFSLLDCPAGGGPDPAASWERFLYSRPAPPPHWQNYVRGAACFLRLKHGTRVRRGLDLLVDSGIPPAGGASSSSALTVLASAAVLGAQPIPFDARALALDAARAEWFVGTRGGTMDHLTICLSRRGFLLEIDYASGKQELLPLEAPDLCAVTFFSHPADKSREVMLHYNERAAVSRILIPALIEARRARQPAWRRAWDSAVRPVRRGDAEGFAAMRALLEDLPERLSLEEAEQMLPEAYGRCAQAFPALVEQRRGRALEVRRRVLHHCGEAARVAAAAAGLRRGAGGVVAATLGAALRASHASLRDLYGLSTPEVEALVEAVERSGLAWGSRLMGGGFGGLVLALTSRAKAGRLVRHVQRSYYGPRGRDARREGSVMISTPGDGLSRLEPEAALRRAALDFAARWRESRARLPAFARLLDLYAAELPTPDLLPIIVAAGKGARARASGLAAPKPVAPVRGLSSIVRVLRALQEACPGARPPVVIVSPETESAVRAALRGREARFVVQPQPLGTGDAVLRARSAAAGFKGRCLAVWSTQPVIRPATYRRTLALASLFDEFAMIVPTAVMKRPYAPVLRDARGAVRSASETHLESAEPPAAGESNIGLFVFRAEPVFSALQRLRRRFWNPAERRYDRPGEELGFPNETIRALAARPGGVLAAPIADRREQKGIKSRADLAVCSRFVRELESLVTRSRPPSRPGPD